MFPEILTKARFFLELKLDGSTDATDGYFMECSGFQRSQEVIEITEVTPQKWGNDGNTNTAGNGETNTPGNGDGRSRGHVVRSKIPGNSTYANITLKRGLTTSMAFWDWMNTIGEGKWVNQRRNGSLVIYGQASKELFRFEFTGAWPVSYKISDLDVTAGDHNIEEVEIVVESLKRIKIKALKQVLGQITT